MGIRHTATILGMVLASCLNAARGEDPSLLWMVNPGSAATYRILPRPLHGKSAKYLPYSTTNLPTPSPVLEARPIAPYAYGWFGAKPSPHWSRHFGYEQRYTQWSLK